MTTTHFLEWFFIRVLRPVYNVQMNEGNGRRIRRADQARQRAARDLAGVRPGYGLVWAAVWAVWAVLLLASLASTVGLIRMVT